jgi:PAS domain S-box-containing protein
MAMRVGELARRTGVGVSTLRAWERRFHFLDPQRSEAGHRLYDEGDLERVDAVLRLMAEGLTLPAAIARAASVGAGALPAGEAEALLYNQILEAVGHGIWVIREGRSRYVNRRMAEIMRYSIDDLATLPILGVFDPAELPVVRQRTERVRAGEHLHFTQQLRRGDGTTFLAEVHTTPLLNQAGRYEGAVALVEDVTERHRAQAEAQLRATLLDSIGEAVTAATPDGTLVYVNAAAERLFGWRAADVLGRHSRDVFPTPAESDEQVARINAVLISGRRYTGRFKMTRRDGTEFVAQMTTVPARDKDGEHTGYVGVISDQTERDLRDRRQSRRDRQAETLALLGAQALRKRVAPGQSALILDEAVEATRRLLDADRAAVLDLRDVLDVLPAPGADELRVRMASPPVDEDVSVPAGSRSFAGYTALSRKVVVVDDTASDRRFEVFPTWPGPAPASAIGAPIFGPSGIVGVLVAESCTRVRFDSGDAYFMQGMANIIGTTLLS